MNARASDLIGTSLVAYGVASTLGESADPRPREQAQEEESRASGDGGGGDGIKARIDRFQKRITPIGFVYAVLKKYGEDGGGRLGATIAYYAFFSVFPALLALVAIAGFVLSGNEELRSDVVDTAVGQFPVIGDSIAEGGLDGSGPALVVGIAGALWAGLGAMMATQYALNTVWDVPHYDRPDAVRGRLRGLLMFAVIGIGLVGVTVVSNIVTQVGLPAIAKVGIVVGNASLNVALALLAFQILTAKMLRWRNLLPGAAVAGLAFYGLQTLGGVLVSRYVSNASDTYGTFALVIGLLTWFHLLSQVTLIAAEVNVVVARKLYPRTLFGDDLTDADERALLGFQRAAARHPASLPPRDAELARDVDLRRAG